MSDEFLDSAVKIAIEYLNYVDTLSPTLTDFERAIGVFNAAEVAVNQISSLSQEALESLTAELHLLNAMECNDRMAEIQALIVNWQTYIGIMTEKIDEIQKPTNQSQLLERNRARKKLELLSEGISNVRHMYDVSVNAFQAVNPTMTKLQLNSIAISKLERFKTAIGGS